MPPENSGHGLVEEFHPRYRYRVVSQGSPLQRIVEAACFLNDFFQSSAVDIHLLCQSESLMATSCTMVRPFVCARRNQPYGLIHLVTSSKFNLEVCYQPFSSRTAFRLFTRFMTDKEPPFSKQEVRSYMTRETTEHLRVYAA